MRGKNFVFSDQAAEHLSLKLPLAEAEAVVATDDNASLPAYGRGHHGWVTLTVRPDEDEDPVAADRGVGPHLLQPRRTEGTG